MIQAAIQILINDASFQAAIGTDGDGDYKVYPVIARQGIKPPYCVVSRTSQSPNSACTDAVGIEVTVVAAGTASLSDYAQADAIINLSRTALTTHTGEEANSSLTCYFNLENIRDGYDKDADVTFITATFSMTVDV